MIEAIGVLIGVYVLVRFMEIMSAKDTPTVMRWVALVGMLVAAIALFALFVSGNQMREALSPYTP